MLVVLDAVVHYLEVDRPFCSNDLEWIVGERQERWIVCIKGRQVRLPIVCQILE